MKGQKETPFIIKAIGETSPGWGRIYASYWHFWMRLPLWLRWALGLGFVALAWVTRS